ncbi:MAG: biotin/lipoyl-binding protein [Nitrospirota bacterium]
MRNKIIFSLAVIGLIVGLVSAYIFSIQKKPQPPVFNPASNPYGKGIYANGIVESYQSNGENINIYPEVSGVITKILVSEGQNVHKGEPLLILDDSIQRATVEQQRSQARAALSLLNELKAEPRRENLEIAKAQVDYAGANLKLARDSYDKQKKAYELSPGAVSRDVLDTAENTMKTAAANLQVADRQYELTKAGAWVYDIKNQENQYTALTKAYQASNALLAKYTINAPLDGVVLSISAAVGSYVSGQGTYETYTQGFSPLLVMGNSQKYFGLRCYIDEILVPRMPQESKMNAQMFIRGTDIHVPLQYVRVQPYVSPKIQLSDQRAERVDVRVLPVIFRFEKPKNLNIYPGQLVDVYIGEK